MAEGLLLTVLTGAGFAVSCSGFLFSFNNCIHSLTAAQADASLAVLRFAEFTHKLYSFIN